MSFCSNCGKKSDGGNFCSGCGCRLNNQSKAAPQQSQYTQQNYVQKNPIEILSEKIKISAIIWSVIAGLQIIIGFINFTVLFETSSGLILWGIAALNAFAAYKDYKYSKEITYRPVGIVAQYQPITSYIITLIYNLIFGGVIGVAGSIYDLTVRNYVMTNVGVFNDIENSFNAQQQNAN